MKDESKKAVKTTEAKTPATVEEIHPITSFYRFLDDFFGDRWLPESRLLRRGWPEIGLFGADMPRVDILDKEKEIIVHANLPGFNKDDIDITVSENSVTIHAKKQQEQEEKTDEYFRREISRGELSRTLALPAEVTSEQAVASYTDGVLSLTLPKVKSTVRHSVKIQ